MKWVIMIESWLQAYHYWHSLVRLNKSKPKQRWVKPSSGGLNAILMELGMKDLKAEVLGLWCEMVMAASLLQLQGICAKYHLFFMLS